MGRGKSWDSTENEALARAWICASEDPITGTNQTSKAFAEALYRRFIEKGPAEINLPDRRYRHRNAASYKSHFDSVSADAQKFYVALRKVRASSPTGVNEENILLMAVAIHIGKTKVMDYNYKDLDRDTWIVFRAWKVLSTRLKWANTSSTSETPQELVAMRETTRTEISPERESANTSGTEGVVVEAMRAARGGTSTTPSGEERYKMGNRNAKLVRQEELRTSAVRSMAESAKRKSTALEDRNDITVFSRPEAASLPESESFFKALRETYLAQALKRARKAREEVPEYSDATESPLANISPNESTGDPVTEQGGTSVSGAPLDI